MNSSPQSGVPPVIPDHQLVRRIGQGAYGEIWLARNVIGTYRAVKVVYRAHFDSSKPYDREFAGLQAFEPVSRSHPGLVDILQVGRNDDAGYIYYVMELADDELAGINVHPDTYSAKTLGREMIRRGRLPATESLQIGTELAAALAHLHEAGLVHRDVKPSNIIFVNGQPKLADVGLVALLADARTFVGSEGYIPPEGPGSFQADVYSLGKVLYEISTGQNRDLFPELPKDIASFEDRETVLELNEVVVKACANKPEARYTTAEVLRADLEMIASGRSVKRLHFVERQLARVTRVAAVAIAAAVASGILAYAVNRFRNREKQLRAEAYVLSGTQLVADGKLHAAMPWFAEALRLQRNDESAAEAHRVRIGAALQQSPRLLQFFDGEKPVNDLRFSPDGRSVLVASEKQLRLHDVATGDLLREFVISNTIYSAAFNRDGTAIAVGNGRSLTLLETSTGKVLFDAKQLHSVLSAEFSPDDKVIALGCTRSCGHLIDSAKGEVAGADLIGHDKEVSYIAFSPDGQLMVTASRDGTAGVWDAKTRQLLARLPHAEWVQDAAFSPDSQRVVTASSDHTLWVWEIYPTPRVIARMEHSGNVQRARFSPDGRWIASVGMDHALCIWNSNTGKRAAPTINMHTPLLTVAFGPEGRRVAIAGQTGGVRIWDLFAESPLNVGHGIVSADGERYVTYISDSFRLWNARNDQAISSPISVSQTIASVSCSADGSTVAIVGTGQIEQPRNVTIFFAKSNSIRVFSPDAASGTVLLCPDGTRLLTTNRNTASVWNALTGAPLFGPRAFPARIRYAAFSADNKVLALACDKTLFVLNAQTGAEILAPIQHELKVRAVAFTRDSSRMVSVTSDDDYNPGEARVWDLTKGMQLVESRLHADGISAAAFSGNGEWIATAGEDSKAFIWNAATGRARAKPFALAWQINSIKFSADDLWLIASSLYEAQLWEVRTGRALTPVFSVPGPAVFQESGFCAGNRRIWLRSSRGLLFWDLPRVEGEPEEILAVTDQLGVYIPAEIEWSGSRLPLSKLRKNCAVERTRFDSTLATWHSQQALTLEREGQWSGAQFHLEQMLKQAPSDNALRTRLEFARSRHSKTLSTNTLKKVVNP